MSDYEHLYGVGLLDDLHNYFPAVLYQPQRFRNIQDFLQYISSQTQNRFNLFDRGFRNFEQTHTPVRANPFIQSVPREGHVSSFRNSIHTQPTVQSTTNTRTIRTSTAPYMNIVTETYDLMPFLTNFLGTEPLAPRISEARGSRGGLTGLDDILNLLRGGLQMEPVPVVPTQDQIQSATHVFESLRNENADAICSICQEGYTDNILIRQIRHCNHMFHRQCIDQWFQQNVHCPVCRFDIREHGHTPSNQSTISTIINETS
jgi:hypothetical protein